MTELPSFPDFAGKAVLITGSTRGIGEATARAFLDAGARVALNGRSPESVEKVISGLGDKARLSAVAGDVRSVACCEAVVRQSVEALGGLDVLVNNAGVYQLASIESSGEELWNEIIDVNLKATFFCSRAALSALRASKGCIVNVASVNGQLGFKNATVYCAAKGGVVNLTRATASELAPDIRVNAVCPAAVDTDMGRQNLDPSKDEAMAWRELKATRPLQRIAGPEEVAAAILYLSSDAARYITGTMLNMDGGITAGG